MISALEKCRALLVELDDRGYQAGYNLFDFNSLQYPLEFESVLSQACSLFPLVTEADRGQLRSKPGSDLSGYFLVYAARLATEGARRKECDYVHKGFVALALANRYDSRDILALLAVLADASNRTGKDFHTILSEVRTLFTDRQRKTVDAFIERNPAMKSVSRFGWNAVGEGSELKYVFS